MKTLIKLKFVISGIFFSITQIFITANLNILNPKNIGWLEIGDGEMEIAWEFFRRQPILQFPLGLNPQYGLELANTIAYDAQIPIMSLILHPFSFMLGNRFQYIGIFLLITFFLNFFFATKIFQNFQLNDIQIVLNSILLSISPIILNRYVEGTHYTLTSAWLIFWAINLTIKDQNSYLQWLLVFNLVVYIHFYYMPFIFTLYLLNFIYKIKSKNLRFPFFIFHIFIILVSVITNMFLIGYFYGGVSSGSTGYGSLKSTLISLIDPSGWSQILKDIPELEGAYEGFSFIGLSSIILFIIYLITFKKSDKTIQNQDNFKPLWISSILLYIFSLSNSVAIGTYQLFTIPLPTFLETLANTFRSSGRYAWLIVFIIFIWLTIKVSKKFNAIRYSIILLLVLLITLFDIWPQLVSEKNQKFISKYTSNLTNIAWKEISYCYKNIRVYPPVLAVDNFYNFVNVANDQEMGINTGRLGRWNQDIINKSFSNMHEQFLTGQLNEDSFYVFTTSDFVPSDFINFYQNIALKTLDENSGWGRLDGYIFIAPNLKNCSNSQNLTSQVNTFGALEKYKYQGGLLNFGMNQNSDNYILINVKMLKKGFETINSNANLILNMSSNTSNNFIIINGKTNKPTNIDIEYKFTVNNTEEKMCFFNNEINFCRIEISNLTPSQILSLSISSQMNDLNKELIIESLEIL